MARRLVSRLPLVAGVLLALAPLGSGTALAGTTHMTLPFTNFVVQNPCNGEVVPFAGQVDIIVHGNQNGQDGHVVISDNTHATGTGDQGNDYILSAQGNSQFDSATVDGTYFQPFHAEIISEGAAPNYSVEGTYVVVVSGGVVTSFAVFSVESTTCHG
jgi:hypothetical protein